MEFVYCAFVLVWHEILYWWGASKYRKHRMWFNPPFVPIDGEQWVFRWVFSSTGKMGHIVSSVTLDPWVFWPFLVQLLMLIGLLNRVLPWDCLPSSSHTLCCPVSGFLEGYLGLSCPSYLVHMFFVLKAWVVPPAQAFDRLLKYCWYWVFTNVEPHLFEHAFNNEDA